MCVGIARKRKRDQLRDKSPRRPYVEFGILLRALLHGILGSSIVGNGLCGVAGVDTTGAEGTGDLGAKRARGAEGGAANDGRHVCRG